MTARRRRATRSTASGDPGRGWWRRPWGSAPLALLLTVLVLLVLPAHGWAAGNAYVTNEIFGSGTVSQFGIGAAGQLAPLTPATVAAGDRPDHVAVTPDGRSAYVTNLVDNDVSQYSIDPVSGALAPKTPATVAAGQQPGAIAVTPDGKSAYVTDLGSGTGFDGNVSQYNIDPVTGALSPKSPAMVGGVFANLLQEPWVVSPAWE